VLRLCPAVLLLLGLPLHAQGVTPGDYARIRETAQAVIGFEILPPRPEPGYSLDHGIAFAGGHVGTGFAGQTQDSDGPFDRLSGQPTPPLALLTGPEGAGLSLATHRAFGSMAIYPLGAAGYPAVEARGEGSIAVIFDEDICALGLLVHTDYADPLGSNADHRGSVTLTAYGRDGARLGHETRSLGTGVSALALRVTDGLAAIAGATLENTDPGGIAVDDLVFGPCSETLG